jgi:phospholipid N-methyltransferase
MSENLLFLLSFVRSPKTLCSIIPTSQSAAAKVCSRIPRDAKVIVEYGPGTGVIAKYLLKHQLLAPDASLILIEKVADLALALRRKMRDPRIHIVHDGAENVQHILQQHGHQQADCILASIPLSSMPADTREHILQETSKALKADGQFIVFLTHPRTRQFLEPHFHVASKKMAWWNFPPLQIFVNYPVTR